MPSYSTDRLAREPSMNTPNSHDQRIAKMTFASVYPMYFAKVEKKGRTIAELDQVIEWLTSFDRTKLEELIRERVTFLQRSSNALR